MIRPGLYCTPNGFEVIAEDANGQIVRIHLPLDLKGMESAGQKILDAVRSMRARTTAGGERPKVVELRRGGAWN